MKLCKEYLLVDIFKCMEPFSISTFIVKDLADFHVLQGSWNPRLSDVFEFI